MGKQNEEKTNLFRTMGKALSMEIREHRSSFLVYVVLRALVILVMILQIFNRNYENVFLCALTLLLLIVPSFLQVNLKIELPTGLEIILLFFVFAAEILGEIEAYYIRFPFWDTMLHTLNGFLMAAIGFSLVDILNRNERFKFELSPFFVAIVAFCFSMTIGVLWEFFECAMDLFFGQDMQKDTIVHAFSSVMLDPEGANHPIRVSGIYDVAVNGQSLGLGGYLDIGLLDTMKDLFVNFVGAVIFSAVGYVYIRNRGKSSIAARFIPRLKKPEADFLEIARERVQEEELEERLSGEERKKKERQREEKPETENVEKGGTDRTS
ncbi:hypothetical protein B5E77_03290 [Lachnoclostridium sp. An131]|uniref:hypothetical protein n=1 Tax=Lachnoclostridium sp. An131 TaxID=1965555 RepID=UPI000B570EAF|nr:hypothetical protein [Lachnoclostridium sp. An131]OUQ28328.1 hypothetical protein B5E77_03290 [Lachnoclostridium sp. An131]